MTGLLQDLRFAVRLLGKSPLLTGVAIASLALGIGATTAVFSLMDALLLRPLPAIPAPAQVVSLVGVSARAPERWTLLSWGDYRTYAERADVFSGLAAVAHCDVSLVSGGVAERIPGLAVSPAYFSTLGIRPARGVLLSPRDDQDAVAVLSFGLWHRHFGADSRALGSSIVLNGKSFTVIGVAPEGFRGNELGTRPEIWFPLRSYSRVATGALAPLTGRQDRQQPWLTAVGRLAPGVALRKAQGILDTVSASLAASYPATNATRRVRVVPFPEFALGQGMRPLVVRFTARLMLIVALVLAVAAINVAGVLLARWMARKREIGVRLSLGASPGRVVRQLFVEGLLLGVLGSVAGILLASACLPLLAQFQLPSRLFARDLVLSGPALLFAVLASVGSTLVFALLPAIQTVRSSVMPRAAVRSLAREGLVTLQIALALVVMIAAGLMLRTLANLRSIDPGFDPAHVLAFSVDLSSARYDDARASAFYQDLLARLERLPGVQAASLAAALPVIGGDLVVDLSVFPEDGPLSRVGEQSLPAVRHALVGSQYFATLGMRLVQGRVFTPDEQPASTGEVVLNETAARLLWPGESALGHRLRLAQTETPFSVVGVVADATYSTLKEKGIPVLYLAHAQARKSFVGSLLASSMTVLVRTGGAPRQVVTTVRKTVHGMDPLLPVFDVATLDDLLASTIGVERQATYLYSGLAFVSVLLALLGLYGVLSNAVAERTREFGIRMSCGAAPGALRRLVIARSTFLAVTGILIGAAAAIPASRIVQSQLYGVQVGDPVTWAVAPAVLLGMSIWISMFPARRATRIDPVSALRVE